jgi:urate oxidase
MADIVDRWYGKGRVRLMHVTRNGLHHEIHEVKVNAYIVLNSTVDYTQGDNKDVIPTDTVKNTIYLLAKKHGIKTIEEFALRLSNHFLTFYSHVLKTNIEIEEKTWLRIDMDGKPHNHAFISGAQTGTRFCIVKQNKHDRAKLVGGLKDMIVLKTTQSGFVGFHRCDNTTLPDVTDRIFSTNAYCIYEYAHHEGVDFDHVAKTVKDAIIGQFAGPATTGLFSPSVQKTMYDACKEMIAKEASLLTAEIQMPNLHYWKYDLSKMGVAQNNDVFFPTDDPSGVIAIKVGRSNSKL